MLLVKPPRLLWAYDHPAARYQEVSLMLEAGAEVIVALGHLAVSQFNAEYHDETHPLNPDWRASCTLPGDCIERIRRADLFGDPQNLSLSLRAYINATVDAIITPAAPDALARCLSWYQGRIIWRVNGTFERAAHEARLRAIDALFRQHHGQIIIASGLKSLTDQVDLDVPVVHLPVWVDSERLPYLWRGSEAGGIVTSISYIDNSEFFRAQYRAFRTAFAAEAVTVLGKNNKKSLHCTDPAILGGQSTDAQMRLLSEARLYVDAGTHPDHLIFPPLEACAMGVPILFPQAGGLARVLRDDGLNDDEIAALGGCADMQACALRAKSLIDDADALADLANRQYGLLIGTVFSRSKAVAALRKLLPRAKPRRCLAPLFGLILRRKPMPSRQSQASTLATTHLDGGSRLFRPADWRGRTGHLLRQTDGQPVLSLLPERDGAGSVIMDYLPLLPLGKVQMSLAVETRHPQSLAASWGEWQGGTFREHALETVPLNGEKVQLVASFTVTPETIGVARELRVAWNGTEAVDVISLLFETGLS